MREIEVWYAIPSANPELCQKTLPQWKAQGYRIAVLQNGQPGEIPADVTVWSDHYPGWARSINQLCTEVVPPDAPIVVTGGDDMLPDPNLHAQEIAAQFLEHFPDTFGVMQPIGDAWLGTATYCGSPWLGRAWIDQMYQGNGPLPDMYHHNWADNELHWVSRCLDALWQRDDLSHYHAHYSRTGDPPPLYWKEHVEKYDRQDVQTFLARVWLGFPHHEPLEKHRVFDKEIFKREYQHHAERYWLTRYGQALIQEVPCAQMEHALARCASKGFSRVMIYGAGSHTLAADEALRNPPVNIVGIIDDDPRRQGDTWWNIPILSREHALTLTPDAVILSSIARKHELLQAADIFHRQGVTLLCLDDFEAAPSVGHGPSSAVEAAEPACDAHRHP